MRSFWLVLLSVQLVSGAPLFEDDFESGSLNPIRWARLGSAFVTNDPVGGTNQVLTFASISSGGDLFSVLIPNALGSYHLEFDFYQPQQPSETENIGYAGTDHDAVLPAGPNDEWVWNARDNPVNVGQWTHISLIITPLTGDPFNLKFEVAGSVPGSSVAFPIYLDNVTLNPVPEPSALCLVACGVLGFLAARYRRIPHDTGSGR